jgi:nucleoside-diphosphate-sugar epimerase
MRALVIGATGFIGTRVADLLALEHGVQVRATVRDYRKAVRLARLPVEWIEDAADPAAMQAAARGCDFVISCAHPFSAPNEKEAALRLCRAAAAAASATTTRRLAFVSSGAIYGASRREIDERTTPQPDTAYGRIKLACERLLTRAHEAGTIRLSVLRPSIVYGPFSSSWTIRPAQQMHDGRLVLPAGAAGACNAIHVDDVARAVVRGAMLDARTPVFLNLTGADRPTWRSFYGFYEQAVRPGSIVEWPAERIEKALAAQRRDRRTLPAVRRVLRDRRVRDRLNEVPALASLNALGKSIGWRGLPPVDTQAAAESDGEHHGAVEHLPDTLRLDLYLRAAAVDGDSAVRILGVTPRPIAHGMVSTCAWLEWAGLAAAPPREAVTA